MNLENYEKKKRLYISILVLSCIVLLLIALIIGKEESSEEASQAIAQSTEVSETTSAIPVESEEEFSSSVSEGTSFEVSEEPSSEPSEEESFEERSEASSEESEEPEESSEIEVIGDRPVQTLVSTNGRAFPKTYIENNVKAEFVAVYNADTGELIYGKNESSITYPASMTKLVTAMLAVEYIGEKEIITVGEEKDLIGSGSSRAWLVIGETMKLEYALDAMLLPSGNDAAYVLAVHIGRNILENKEASIQEALDAFVKRANEFIQEIGCKNTHFTCPDGYHDDMHYTTAYDFCLISAKALTYPLIAKVVKKDYAHGWFNTNKMLSNDDWGNFVTGLKTGHTTEAGYCLALSADYDGASVVIIIINSPTQEARVYDSTKLLSAAFGLY